jgi:DNA-binding NarL/FixJ family response regulator
MLEILIADDHALLRRGLRDLLETQSSWHVCAEAADGRQAVDLVEQHRPDVAVLDLFMPELDGAEASRRIREVSPSTAVLILSGSFSDELVERSSGCGVRAYVAKVQAEQQLVGVIASLERKGEAPARARRTALQPPALTPRESEITRLLAAGKSNWAIATILGISSRTVETHRANVMGKLGLESVVELVHYAIRNGLAEP